MTSFYYSSDKTTFQNKFEALKHRRSTNNAVYFYYNDDVWANIDWTQEPPGSLEFHYKNQAQRIRDAYDYVVLFYSGGYDSTNILETFHFNNIKLDKVVCVGAFGQDAYAGSDENHNGELYKNAFPYLVELGLEKITQICDYSKLFNDVKNFSVYEYGAQWVEEVGPWFSPHNWFWRDIHKHVVPKGMADKKVALIWGKDKPNLERRSGQVGFTFSDVAALSYAGNTKIDNIERINFYWDPNYPLLVVKQAHEMLKANEFINPNIVYKLKKRLTFKSPKSPSNLLSLRDKFLLKHSSSSLCDFYTMGLNRMQTKHVVNEAIPQFRSMFHRIS
jgi:hypothetical protein